MKRVFTVDGYQVEERKAGNYECKYRESYTAAPGH